MRPSVIGMAGLLPDRLERYRCQLRRYRYLGISFLAHACVGAALDYLRGYLPEQADG